MGTITPRPVLALGVTAAVAATKPVGMANVLPPAGNATRVLWDSEQSYTRSDAGFHATRYRRLILALKSNGDGTITVSGAADGTNFDFVDTFAYTAATPSTGIVNYMPRCPRVKVEFTDTSGSTPTTWRFSLMGDESSADPGA